MTMKGAIHEWVVDKNLDSLVSSDVEMIKTT